MHTTFEDIESSGWDVEENCPQMDDALWNLRNFLWHVSAKSEDFELYQFRVSTSQPFPDSQMLSRAKFKQHWVPDNESLIDCYIAEYNIYVNVAAGILIRSSSFAPKDPWPDPAKPITNPPPIKKWSDIAWLTWDYACRKAAMSMRNPTWIVAYEVINPTSLGVADRIKEEYSANTSEFPSLRYGVDSDAGKMLIGCPNGYGAAWLLINRVYVAGPRIVDRVHMFDGDDGKTLCFAYALRDVTEQEITDAFYGSLD